MRLTESDLAKIEAMVAEVESQCRVQLVATIADKSDSYPEIPWQAFGIGVAFATLAGLLIEYTQVSWIPLGLSPLANILAYGVSILAAGLTAALLTIWLPPFASLLLHAHRRESETRRYAESLFLSRELFRTSERNAVLVLVSLFEHEAVILADRGVRALLPHDETVRIALLMRTELRRGRPVAAFETGFAALQAILGRQGVAAGGGNEIPNQVMQSTDKQRGES